MRKPTLRGVLDVVTSVALVAAALTIILRQASPSAVPSEPVLPPVPSEPQTLVGAWTKGSAAAPYALIVYSDFQCPFCGRFAREVLPRVERDFVNSNQLLVAFRHFPIERIHPFAMAAAQAAECAGMQKRFWPFHDALFAEGASLDNTALRKLASDIGLNGPAWEKCMAGERRDKVTNDLSGGRSLAIAGTPAFLIGAVDGVQIRVTRVISGYSSVQAFMEILGAEVAVKKLASSTARVR